MEFTQIFGTVLFACAVVHTFMVKKFVHQALRYPPGSIRENLFHFLGEVEIVFGLWAGVLVLVWCFSQGSAPAIEFLESLNFTEPMFVFVIMAIALTHPVLYFARLAVTHISAALPLAKEFSLYIVTLIVGPLAGSLITEPAAMAVTAYLLKDTIFDSSKSVKFRYATLGLLFVNVSIGGTLTHFAAPPVLMVAGAWKWDTWFMATTFGWKALISIVVGTLLTGVIFYKEILKPVPEKTKNLSAKPAMLPPWWLVSVHYGFLLLTVVNNHHTVFFLPLFLFFIGWCTVTKEYQEPIRIRESLLVGFFLGGLVVLGSLQGWWLQPIIERLSEMSLFIAATVLTAVVDNAALTYLGTQVQGLSDPMKYALVAGAVTGGGLTVIANAPNPVGFGILKDSFGKEGISPLALLLAALPFTILAALSFIFL